MELIFYPEAAKITGTTIGSVYQAVSRGDLSRAGKRGRNLCLVREQVELFRNHPMVKRTLNREAQKKWEHYDQEAKKLQSPDAAAVNEATLGHLIEEKLQQFFDQQEAARLEAEEQAARERKERFHKEHPFLKRAEAVA